MELKCVSRIGREFRHVVNRAASTDLAGVDSKTDSKDVVSQAAVNELIENMSPVGGKMNGDDIEEGSSKFPTSGSPYTYQKKAVEEGDVAGKKHQMPPVSVMTTIDKADYDHGVEEAHKESEYLLKSTRVGLASDIIPVQHTNAEDCTRFHIDIVRCWSWNGNVQSR
ncbi:hypothetical protein SLA2020_036010 [Shorea laevis]